MGARSGGPAGFTRTAGRSSKKGNRSDSRSGLRDGLAPGSEMSRHVPKTAALAVEVVSSVRLRAPGLARWLRNTAPRSARGAMVVALVSDARVRQLNARYRGRNAPTDVLSFAGDEPGFLGEVVIASGVAGRQARRAGHPVLVELQVLALHGLLHLLGYDHERDDGRMARVERRLRRKGGLREGLIERGRE